MQPFTTHRAWPLPLPGGWRASGGGVFRLGKRLGLGSLVVALTGLCALPVRADTRTAESIWSQSDALQRATAQVPLQDREAITQTRCQEVGVGRMGSLPRFRCTVWFTPGAPAAQP